MNIYYRIITVLFAVLILWIPAWFYIPIIPFPYLLYVGIYYGVNPLLFGLVCIVLFGAWGAIMLLQRKPKPPIQHREGESGETADIEQQFVNHVLKTSPPNVRRWFEIGDEYYSETLAEKRP